MSRQDGENEMEFFELVDWDDLKHYRVGKNAASRPAWIKLYLRLLRLPQFQVLPDCCKWHVLGIQMIATDHDNRLLYDPAWVGKELAATEAVNLDLICTAGFIRKVAHPRISGTNPRKEERRVEESREEKKLPAEAGTGKGRLRRPRKPLSEPRKESTGVNAQLIRRFTDRWQVRWGERYFFQAKDGVACANVMKAAGQNLERACRIVDRYLASSDPFLVRQKHPATLLWNQINRFLSDDEAPDNSGGFVAREVTQEDIDLYSGGPP